jgi:hypothetical protein
MLPYVVYVLPLIWEVLEIVICFSSFSIAFLMTNVCYGRACVFSAALRWILLSDC